MLGSRIVWTTSATTSAGTTIRFGTMRRSRSVTVTATITAQPSTSTSASSERPNTATQHAASAIQTTTAATRSRTSRHSPRCTANPLPRSSDGIPPHRVAVGRACSGQRSVDCGARARSWRRGARTEGRCASHTCGGLRVAGSSGRRRRCSSSESGGIAALDLSRTERSEQAFMMAMALAALAGAATSLLVMRLLAAQRLALRDPLTGLPNRVLLDDRISPGARALAALGRAVRAARRRPRRVQGRQRHPGPRGGEHRPPRDRPSARGGRPRDGHRRTRRRRRVRRALARDGRATTRPRRSPGGCGTRCAARTGSTAASSRSTRPSAGRSSRRTG